MQNFSSSPTEMFLSFWRNYGLIKTLVKREVIGRYRGSLMGILWSFFNPLLMLAVYTFVFGIVFKSRWSGGSDSKTEFALVLFAGLITFNIFAECISKSPSLILSNANYVKKVVFPLEILPLVILGSALFHALISWGVWLLAYIIFLGIPHQTIVFLPIVLLPLVFFTAGISWWLASLGIYIRDVSQIVGVFVTILMFLSPIFFPSSALPEGVIRNFLELNPLTTIIEEIRNIMLWGKMPNWTMLVILSLLGLFTAWLGFVWFQKTRKGFADVI